MTKEEYKMIDETTGKTVRVFATSLKEAETKFDRYLDASGTGESNADTSEDSR